MNSTEECSAMNVDGLIAESELKISNIDSQFEHLQSMRAAEYKKIAALKYLSSSLHGLPTEVLCEIFLYTVAPVRTKKKLTVIENPNAILPISQVCHFWREVAHNTPHLWTDLCITVTTYPSDAFIAGIKTWLGRSRQLPLSITIAANVKHTNSLLIDEILLVRSRVAHLELTMPTYYSAIAPLLDAQLDALQTLRMNQRSLPDMYSMWAEKRDLATFAPNLRNLSVDYLAYWPEFFSNTPWSQLLHLRISSTNLERLGVLRQCVNLETLALRIGDWVTLDHVVGSADLTLPNLLHIELCVFSDTISPIFQQLVLPVLVSFRIDFEYPSPFVSGPIVWPQQSFLQFQKRCPTIQYLGLRYTTALTSNELIPILRSFPALKRLSLVSCTGCVDENLLQALQYQESDPEPLVPHLEEISWDKIVGHDFEESTLEDMIRSRWRPAGQSPAVASSLKIARLRSIAIRCGNPSFSSAFIARMRDCIEDGNTLIGRSRSRRLRGEDND